VREIDLKPADGLDWVSASHRLRSTFDAEVTPKLELYAGLDEGRPRLVPLAVYLFKGTSKFGEYVSKEDGAFRQLFTPLADGGAVGQVVHASDVVAYSDIRDRVHIPLEARAQHTTVFQVDGFWALGRVRSLASQRNYLGQRPNSRSDPYTDPFGLFRGRPSKGPDDAPDKNEATEVTEENARRVDYFKNKFYRTRATGLFNPSSAKTTDERHPDRVPFMWEFGFVTVKSSAWEGARREPIKFHRGDRSLQVGQVLDALEGHRPRRARGNPMSWREFLGACKTVSDFSERLSGGTPIPFDFASTSSETLNALLLEVWLSEIVLALRGDAGLARKAEYREWLPRLSSLSAADYSPAARGVSLVDLLKAGVRGSTTEAWAKTLAETTGWQDVEPSGQGTPEQCKRAFEKRQKAFQDLPLGVLCLYKTWLLLLDVLDIESLLKADNSFSLHQPKQASARALAARHWYRTACDPTGNGDGMGESVIVLRLPGHFITRGDSFLASPETSRSRLLAWQAMDLLSSRRSNLIRLQMGLGLPVRDVLPDEICGDLRTALRCANRRSEDLARDRRTLHEMTYEDLAGRGARYDNATKEVGGGFSEARWLFRNAISDYDRISRPIQKWLARLLHWTVAYRASHVTTWAGGFHAYDELADCRLDTIRSYPSFVEFAKQCDFLAADLEAAAQRQR
jgi:hypothetical protein